MAARIVFGLLLAPLAGVLVDRLNRKKVMVACDLGRAAVVATLPWVDSVPGLVVASFLLEIGTLLWSPAKEASVPNLVPPERLTTANSLSLVAAYGTFPIASLMFALLAKVADWLGSVDALGFLKFNQEALAFYIDVASFVTSAVLIASLPLWSPRQREVAATPDALETGQHRKVGKGQAFQEFKEGWHYIFVNPVIRSVIIGLGIGVTGGGMLVPLGAVFSVKVLGAGAAGFGLFITALGFGVAAGVGVVTVFQSRLNKVRFFGASLIVAGASMIVAAGLTTLALVLVFVFILGICAGSVYVLGFTLLQENTEDELRGRIFSALYTLVRLCLLIAFAVGPFLAEALDALSESLFINRTVEFFGGDLFLPGVRLTLWLSGILVLVAGVLTGLSLRAGRRRQQQAEGADEPTDAPVDEPA
jgi:dTMP kinase